jgi:hypothetical protein
MTTDTGQLVRRLGEQVTTLVRGELTLARMEMVEKGRRAGRGAGLLGEARAEIAHTRQELHDTAAALAAKTSVWAHLRWTGQATAETAARFAESVAEAGERLTAWRRRGRP